MAISRRNHTDEVHGFVSPFVEMNVGLWLLFAGATFFLGLRVWVKLTRRYGLWIDDYILLVCWIVLLANNSLIVHEFATGYILEDSSKKWDDRMRILINISSCGTLIGQAWTKTAFAVTLLRMGNWWQKWALWFCIVTMNLFMIFKVIFQWAKICDEPSYDNWFRLDFCIYWKFREDFKEGGNVYNIIMDFVFASFPWLITRSLEMRRIEKIGLCATMSLGMLVAIVSAIRVAWKDQGNVRDEYYIYRNGLSQVWYSSEITGTIIVQCMPILRPILREMHSTWTSNRRASYNTNDPRTSWISKISMKRASAPSERLEEPAKGTESIVLSEIPEDRKSNISNEPQKLSPPPSRRVVDESESPFRDDVWPLSGRESSDIYGSRSFDTDRDGRAYSIVDWDAESGLGKGLSPPPRRLTR